MISIGIDPGKNGGYAMLDPDNNWICAKPWDDDQFIANMELVATIQDKKIACVEKVGAMPGQGVTSMFSFGKSAGFIEGVLRAFDIPYQLISPQRWKKEFGLGHDKGQSIAVCKKLFPDVGLKRTEQCRKDHDGMAEALLMAEYARRHL